MFKWLFFPLPCLRSPLGLDYLAEIAQQLGSLSPFLGGFAAAFLGTLLAIASPRRTTSWTIASAALAAVALMVVVASNKLVTVLHPKAPGKVGHLVQLVGTRTVAVLRFLQ